MKYHAHPVAPERHTWHLIVRWARETNSSTQLVQLIYGLEAAKAANDRRLSQLDYEIARLEANR